MSVSISLSSVVWGGVALLTLGFGGGWLASDSVARIPIIESCGPRSSEPTAVSLRTPTELASCPVVACPSVESASLPEEEEVAEDEAPEEFVVAGSPLETEEVEEEQAPEGTLDLRDQGNIYLAPGESVDGFVRGRITEVKCEPPLLTWSSSSNGLRLQAVSQGDAVLTVTTTDGLFTLPVQVAVDEVPEPEITMARPVMRQIVVY